MEACSVTTPRKLWAAIACSDPESNGPEECFREVIGGELYTSRSAAIEAAKASGLPFYEDMPGPRYHDQWCTVDTYRVRTRDREGRSS
jgi:hypothetical protein